MLMANMFLLPLFMQEILGFTATQSGISLMPRVLVMMLITPFVGRFYNKVPPRLVIGVGIVLVALGSINLGGLTLDSGLYDIVVAIMVQGVGFACLFVPLTTLALSRVPRHKLADAAGLNSLVRQVGGAIGLSIFATLLSNHSTTAQAGLAAQFGMTRPEVVERLSRVQAGLMANGMDLPHAHTAALRLMQGMVARQAMVLSFEWVFVLAGGLFLAVIPLLWFLKSVPSGAPAPGHVEV
jgi:DHA2 family multidrug resistance protein